MKNRLIVTACETGFGYWMKMNVSNTLRAEGENRPSRPSLVIVQAKKNVVRKHVKD